LEDNEKYSDSDKISNTSTIGSNRLPSLPSVSDNPCSLSTKSEVSQKKQSRNSSSPLNECVQDEDWFSQCSESSSCHQSQGQRLLSFHQKDTERMWQKESGIQFFESTSSNTSVTDMNTKTVESNGISYRGELDIPQNTNKTVYDKNASLSSQLHQTSDSLLSETSPAGSPESQASDSGSATSEVSSDSTNSLRSSDEESVYIPHDRDRSISCGQSSLFGELQSVVFNSLITSLES